MNYPCNLIKDLFPLYHDGVCSGESKEAVEQHLGECSCCKEYYAAMCETDEIIIPPPDTDMECQKAASFQSVRRKLLRRQILAVAASFALITGVALAVAGALKNSVNIVKYEDNISVSMTDGGLTVRLNGSRVTYVESKRVAVMEDGQERNYLFFCVSDTKWSDLTTGRQVFSEYVLCPADKGAEQIDGVYYYTGEYAGIESMDSDALRKITDASELLWSR